MGVAGLAATLIISSLTANRVVQRKLKLSTFLFAGYVLVNVIVAVRPDLVGGARLEVDSQLRAFERVALAAALINLLVISLLNPLRVDRVADRFPTILQDAIVIGLLLIVTTFVFEEKLLTTSAISAVVIGFALQDTLGNAFAGLAIQSERPFNVGHWIQVGQFEGRVMEVTWRATKLRTKTGNFVILPNNLVAKEAITNYSEPTAPTMLDVEVGVSYDAAPNDVKRVVHQAMAQCASVLATPAPDVILRSFDGSAITYRARFWVMDYERDETARDQVRTAIYYAFARNGIEIPYPIQVQYDKPWPAVDDATRQRHREALISGVDIFQSLAAEHRQNIAAHTVIRPFGDGEVIVRQGQPGQTMYIVAAGRAAVVLEPHRQVVATIERGGYFGEMSLLTGDPRSATVLAQGDTLVLEIDAELFRRLGVESPQAIERIGVAAMTRRGELDEARAAARGAAVADAPATFLTRMKRFLRLSS
jgi:small-conductance mechanosensitive channel/CRP-like cAMP-binding protein